MLCSSGDDAKPEAECRWVRIVPGTMWMLRSLASAWCRGRQDSASRQEAAKPGSEGTQEVR